MPTQQPVTLVAYHARSGVAALNVVTGALDADARTQRADVVFARDVPAVVRDRKSVV